MIPITEASVSVFTIPTDGPESDSTLEWTSTTIVIVGVQAGRVSGLGYTYGHKAIAVLIQGMLLPLIRGRDAMDVMGSWVAMTQAMPIIVLEPSCFAVFRDEGPSLSNDRPIARAIAERAILFDGYIAEHFERGALPALSGHALVHLHCHQQALVGREPTSRALSASRLDARILDAGCCGMAGSFGYDKAHYRVSIDVGERALLPAVRAARTETTIIADGFSCREQIHQLTGRRAYHFAEVVAQTFGSESR